MLAYYDNRKLLGGGGAIELKDKLFDYGSEMRAETARLKTHADQHI